MVESVGWDWNNAQKETWHFTDPKFPHIDENTVIKTEGAEVNVPHFYVDLDDILRLFKDFTITKIRHIQDAYIHGFKGNSKHYYIEATLNKTNI